MWLTLKYYKCTVGEDLMTREEVKQHLLEGGCASYHVWIWNYKSIICDTNCCNDWYDNIEETLDCIESHSDGKWDQIRLS